MTKVFPYFEKPFICSNVHIFFSLDLTLIFMKKALSALFLLFGISQLFASQIVIERPPFSISNTTTVEVEKIILSDTATVLYMKAFYRAGWWIQIASGTYIQADGKKWMVKSAEGIEFDKECTMDSTGQKSFALIFPSIDRATKQLDFIESDCENCFKIWGITLSSNVLANRVAVPQEALDALSVEKGQAPLEAPKLETGIATLKGQLLGYRPEMKMIIETFVNNPVTNDQEIFEFPLNASGVFEARIPLVCSMQVLFRTNDYNEYILLTPGQESGVYFDLQQKSQQEARLRVDKSEPKRYIYFSGANSQINNQLSLGDWTRFPASWNQMQKEISGMNAEQYRTYVLGKYENALKELENKGLSPKAFSLAKLSLQYNALYMLMFGDSNLKEAFIKTHKLKRGDPIEGYVEPVFDASYFSFLKNFPINDPISLYCGDFPNMVNSCKYLNKKTSSTNITAQTVEMRKMEETNACLKYLADILGTDKGIVFDLIKAQNFAASLEQNTLISPYALEAASSMENPFFKQYLQTRNDEMKAKIEANKGKEGLHIYETPKTPNDSLFAAILKPFAGKVILVDFWATWCSPCRNAMKRLEPAKEQYKGKEVVFIYLTDESSPLFTWQNMIPDIPGEHFRLSNDQFNYLKNKFDVKGVPSYLLLNKKGEQVYFHVGFEGVDKVTGLINKELE
jgi:thiol-disulfide isomerase/thioredoxin